MADCPSIAGCPFYNDKMADRPALADIYKKRYCKENNEICARWKVASTLGKEAVPSDLFPNQFDKAEALISKSAK